MSKGKWKRNSKKEIKRELDDINTYAFAMKPEHPNNPDNKLNKGVNNGRQKTKHGD